MGTSPVFAFLFSLALARGSRAPGRKLAKMIDDAHPAAIHIANNDADENPFDITVTGTGLAYTNDTDGDGLTDKTEWNGKYGGKFPGWQGTDPKAYEHGGATTWKTGAYA